MPVSVLIQAAWRVPGKYLVILRQGTHGSHVQRTMRRLQAKAARRGYLPEILQTYSGALKGFLVRMSSDVLHLVTVSPVCLLSPHTYRFGGKRSECDVCAFVKTDPFRH